MAMANSSKVEKSADVIEDHAPTGETGGSTEQSGSSGSSLPAEFDHRGIRLPARTRVGGIIIPQ
jgi:hypothetical protein